MLCLGTCSRSASSAPLQARRGLLSSSAVTRWRRVGGRGPRGRAGARRGRGVRASGGGGAGGEVQRGGVYGDFDRGDGGRGGGAAIIAVEVAGGRALDLAGAVAGAA